MRMNRRNVVLGLGTIVAGGGGALATGAFSSVEADRTVSVQTAGDASAYLGLSSARSGGDYVDTTGSTIKINIDGSGGSASGINQNAKSQFDNLVTVTNNGTQNISTVNLSFTVTDNGEDGGIDDGSGGTVSTSDVENALKIRAGDSTYTGDGNTDLTDQITLDSNGDASSADILSSSQSLSFGIEVDLLNSNISDLPDPNNGAEDYDITLTITATTS